MRRGSVHLGTAARTVNKERARSGESRTASGVSTRDEKSASGGNP